MPGEVDLAALQATVERLERKVRALEATQGDSDLTMAKLMRGGLRNMLSGHGFQDFGGGRGRMADSGIQNVVGSSVGTKYFYMYGVSSLLLDPANTLPLLAHGAYINGTTAIQDDSSAYITASNYGRTFVYADNVPSQRGGVEAARGATIARGFANIGAADDGHFKIEPAALFASVASRPTGLAAGGVWYGTDNKLYVYNGTTDVDLGTSGAMKVSGSGYQVMPANAAAVTVTAGAGAWTKGNYAQILASTGEADYITHVVLVGGASSFEVDIATGGAGSETVVSTVAAYVPSNTTVVIPLDAVLPVATTTRIAARCASTGGNPEAVTVKLIYVEQADMVSL